MKILLLEIYLQMPQFNVISLELSGIDFQVVQKKASKDETNDIGNHANASKMHAQKCDADPNGTKQTRENDVQHDEFVIVENGSQNGPKLIDANYYANKEQNLSHLFELI